MNKTEKLNLIRETGVIAIMRAQSPDQLTAAADAIKKGGVRVMEPGDASGMALWNPKTGRWSEKVIKAISPDLKNKLPEKVIFVCFDEENFKLYESMIV